MLLGCPFLVLTKENTVYDKISRVISLQREKFPPGSSPPSGGPGLGGRGGEPDRGKREGDSEVPHSALDTLPQDLKASPLKGSVTSQEHHSGAKL